MTMDEPLTGLKMLRGYKHKAQLLRQIHSDLYSKYQIRSSLLNAGCIILTTIITIISVGTISNLFDFLNSYANASIDMNFANSLFSGALALFALIVLSLSIADLILNWRNKCLAHESGVKLLTSFITSVREVEDMLEDKSLTDIEAKFKIEEVKNRYELLGEILPLIPDQDFLDSKQKYLIKRKISERMDTEPCININLDNYINSCKKRNQDMTISDLFK
jgi:hypothetical protein